MRHVRGIGLDITIIDVDRYYHLYYNVNRGFFCDHSYLGQRLEQIRIVEENRYY
jgi:hypothetical protein